MKKVLVLASFLAVNDLSSSEPGVSSMVTEERTVEPCVPCELFFSNLERNEENGMLSQVVRIQERGEPKSGTGMMFDWAAGALVQTCDYLQQLYGTKSCVADFSPGPEYDGDRPPRPVSRRLTFEPALSVSEARCPCETIERVTIAISRTDKHTLPVNRKTCAFSHNFGIELAPAANQPKRQKSACNFADGTPAKNNDEIWRCMREADCEITDDWLQMVVFRDPRPAAVSAYYHLQLHNSAKRDLGELEEFVARELPMLCEWMAVRYILFSGFLADKSMEFWYEDSMDNPLGWYYHWFYSVGLQLPANVVQAAADAAAANNLGFPQKHVDKHPGEEVRNDTTSARRFEDEVTPEVVEASNDVLRVWLPPILLEKLGVGPE